MRRTTPGTPRDSAGTNGPKRVQHYLEYVERLLNPNLFIIGGGVSKKSEKFLPEIHIATPVVPAGLHNDAGIVGAAHAAKLASRGRK